MALPSPLRLVSLAVLSACVAGRTTPVTPPPLETIHLQLHEGTGLALDLSRDGQWIAFDLLGQLWRVPAAGGAAVALTDAVRDTAEDQEPAIASDGRRIVFRGERRGRRGLWLLEPGGAVRQLTQLDHPDGYDGKPSWSPDGRVIAFTRLLPPDSASPRPRTGIALLDPGNGAVRTLPLPAELGAAVNDAAWHPDGRRLAVVAGVAGRRGGRIWLVDTTGSNAVALTDSGIPASRPAISPSGDRLAFFAPDPDGRTQLWVRELRAPSRPRLITSQGDVTPASVAWTPDGSRLVYAADGRIWTVAHTGGVPASVGFSAELSIDRPVRRLPPARFAQPGMPQPARGFMGLALSPDGHRIGLIALGALWVAELKGAARRVAALPAAARYLTWSPDGAELAWAAGEFEHEDVFATDVRTGATRRITALAGREAFPAWSPDGRWIAFVHAAQEAAPHLRIVPARDTAANIAATRDLGEVPSEWTGTAAYAPVWSPDASRLLVPAPNYDATAPAGAELIGLDGTRRAVQLAHSPIFVQWSPGSLTYIRHARLWRLAFDTAGVRGAPEPLGEDAAFFPSVSRTGAVLYLSEGGLRVRERESTRHIGWPIEFTPPVPEPLVIANARIVAGDGTAASAPRDVLIERGRIVRIDSAGSSRARGERIDAGGRFLMPGLIDLHAHQYVNELLPGFLYFGITTMRDQGAPIGPLVAYADAVAAGIFPGPRLAYGGFQFYSDWYFDAEDGHGIEPEADPDHIRRAVALAEALGAQHVKTRTFRRWDINARMVDEAHRRGMRATGHCAHLLPLVAAGFDSKEHAGFCNGDEGAPTYDDRVQLYRAAGIGFVPTVIYTALAARLDRPDYFAGDAELAHFMLPITNDDWMIRLNAEGRRREAAIAATSRATTLRMARAGVVVGTGTDVWQVPTGVHLEMEELVAAGLTPLEAIRAATASAARILGAEGELGTVEVGKRADLVLLDADPTTDIRNTRRIRAVIRDGKLVDRADLQRRYGRSAP